MKRFHISDVFVSIFVRHEGSDVLNLGCFAWELSFRTFRFGTFVWEPRLGSSALNLRLETFVWDLLLGNFRVVNFVWDPWVLSLENFILKTLVW